MQTKKVVLLSGGLDSTILSYKLVNEFGADNVHALTFFYKQKHDIELTKAKLTASKLGIEHHIIDIGFLGDMVKGVSSLAAGSAIATPNVKEVLGQPQPSTYIPCRNMILSAIAASYAEATGADEVYIATQYNDIYSYWDVSEAFIASLNDVLKLNRVHDIQVKAPFVNMTKSEEIAIGVALNVPFEDCHSCFVAGTLIHTNRGLVPIEFVEIGELVYTHTGKLKPVTNTMVNDYNGDLYTLDTTGSMKLQCTKLHPIYTTDGFINIENLNIEHKIPIIKIINSNDNFAGEFTLSKEFALFLGHFAAEGSYLKRDNYSIKGIDLSINSKEKDHPIVQNSIAWLTNNSTNTLIIRENSKFSSGTNIKLHDVSLSTKLSRLITSNLCDSRNYEFLLHWNVEFQYEFLKGLFFGDGFYNKANINVSCIDLSLINIAYNIFIQNNIYPRMYLKPAKNCNGKSDQLLIRIADYQCDLLCEDSLNISVPKNYKQSRMSLIDKNINKKGERKIRAITKNHFSGKVYNLTVLDDESYIANTIPVHNCYSPNEVGASCGVCSTCADRIANFIQAGVKDPVPYQIDLNWDQLLTK